MYICTDEHVIQRLNNFIRKYEVLGKWRWAKTYAKKAPHWYLLKKDVDDKDLDTFILFVKFIKVCGYTKKFNNWTYKYVKFGKYKYWVMDDFVYQVDLINRDIPNKTSLDFYMDYNKRGDK